MISLTGGLTVVLESSSDVSYGRVEAALNAQAFLGSSYLIDRQAFPGMTQLTISVHVPIEAITKDGAPQLSAVTTLRAVADAIETLEQPE